MEFNLVRCGEKISRINFEGIRRAVSVLEAKIQLEIEWSDSTKEMFDLKKKHEECQEQLEKRLKKWSQIRFWETKSVSSYKHDFKYQEGKNKSQKID